MNLLLSPMRTLHHVLRYLFVAATLCCIDGEAARAEDSAAEYTIKAGILVALAQYTTWPDQKLSRPDAVINICVLGKNPFGSVLEKTALLQKGRPIVVHETLDVQEAIACQIVFIADHQNNTEQLWLSQLLGKSIVTVGESDQAILHGSVLNLVMINERIRFEVNWMAMEKARIRFSAPMLALAHKIHRMNEESP
jgi:hypothetical protein